MVKLGQTDWTKNWPQVRSSCGTACCCIEVEAESDKSSNSLTTITERTSVDRSVAKRTGDSKGVEPVANGDDEVLVFNAHKFYSFTK